jgi:hypothetical protein
VGKPIQYVAVVTPVREVSLLGTADLAFWRDRLRDENVSPAECDGQAQLMICATDAKFMGIRFRELSVSVFVSRHKGAATRDGAYLVHAYNSSRFFAFVERTWFSTPYYHGAVHTDARLPAAIRLTEGGDIVFRAEMAAGPAAAGREPAHSGEGGWEGPVFLPGTGRPGNAPGLWFYAKLSGHTRSYPFAPSDDVVTFRPSDRHPVFRWLGESAFSGTEWVVRDQATHAKSKTYRRTPAPGFGSSPLTPD